MNAASLRPLVTYRELLATSVAVDGGTTIAVDLPAPVIDYITTICKLCGRTPADWVYQALIERVERQGDEARRTLQDRRGIDWRNDVPPDAPPVTSPVIDAIDRVVNDRVAAAHAAGDDRVVDRLLARKLAFKLEIENLSPIERDIIADRVLRELQAEVVA